MSRKSFDDAQEKRSSNAPKREEIVELLNQLPSKIEALLKKCARVKPPYVPNYYEFTIGAIELLRPFFEYADAMFHAGCYSDVFRLAVRVFAAKKMERECRLKKIKQKPRWYENVEAIETFMQFKLLFHFFRYAEEEYPGNVFRLFDLEYRFEMEKDPEARKKLIEEALEIFGQTSTYFYFQALLEKDKGNLDKALRFCEQAISRFPGNTPVYKLKAEILQIKAQRALEEGLQQEPRDKVLLVARKIENSLWKLRKKCTEGLLDLEEVIEHLEQIIEEEIKRQDIDLQSYEEEVKKSLRLTDIAPATMKFLCTGEFLLTKLFRPLDYAASVVEFCKAVENEMYERLFKPFKSWCLKNLPSETVEYDKTHRLFDFIYRDKKFTLGEMAMIFQFLRSSKLCKKEKLLEEFRKFISSFIQTEILFCENGIASIFTPDKVQTYRNSAAHLSEFTLEKAEKAKKWCYQVLNLLTQYFPRS